MNRLFKKLKGYQKAPRERFKLFTDLRFKLTTQEFVLYEFLSAITDWDTKHEAYGTIKCTNQEIAEFLGWKSDTTVLKHKRSLIKKSLLFLVEDNQLKVRGFEKWQLRISNPSKNNYETAEKQFNTSKIEDKASEIKENRSQNGAYSLVSSRVDLSLDEPINENLSDDELIQIISNIDSKGLASESDPSQRFEEEHAY